MHASRQLEMPRNSGRALMCGSFLYSLCRQLSHRREDFLPQGFSNTLCSDARKVMDEPVYCNFQIAVRDFTGSGFYSVVLSLRWIERPKGLHTALSRDRKSTRLSSSHSQISYAVFCLKKKKTSSDGLTFC